MHTIAPPKQKLHDPSLDGRIVADVRAFLEERIELAIGRGVAFEQLMLDPGPDFSKTPAQTIEVLRALRALAELGRPILLAVSPQGLRRRADRRGPRERLAGTLAALGHGVDAGAHVLRVHDVAAAADFLTVRAALRGDVRGRLRGSELADGLRWAQGAIPPLGTLDSDAANRRSLAQRDRSPPIIHRLKEPHMSVLDRSALEASPLADLHAIASELSIDGYRRLRRPS